MSGKGDNRRPADTRQALDCSRGHALADVKGRCWRCGEQIAEAKPRTDAALPGCDRIIQADGSVVHERPGFRAVERTFHIR